MAKQNNAPDSTELPIGFAMALAQNGPAMAAFAGLDELAQEKLIARAKQAQSKADMRDIIQSIGGPPSLS
ncbi:MAG: hypothetical protein IJZ08_09270 [Clostridia bacterium]|nr:hypothetical protein [Clostridia bacterium]